LEFVARAIDLCGDGHFRPALNLRCTARPSRERIGFPFIAFVVHARHIPLSTAPPFLHSAHFLLISIVMVIFDIGLFLGIGCLPRQGRPISGRWAGPIWNITGSYRL
jgi:hypothetical protein